VSGRAHGFDDVKKCIYRGTALDRDLTTEVNYYNIELTNQCSFEGTLKWYDDSDLILYVGYTDVSQKARDLTPEEVSIDFTFGQCEFNLKMRKGDIELDRWNFPTELTIIKSKRKVYNAKRTPRSPIFQLRGDDVVEVFNNEFKIVATLNCGKTGKPENKREIWRTILYVQRVNGSYTNVNFFTETRFEILDATAIAMDSSATTEELRTTTEETTTVTEAPTTASTTTEQTTTTTQKLTTTANQEITTASTNSEQVETTVEESTAITATEQVTSTEASTTVSTNSEQITTMEVSATVSTNSEQVETTVEESTVSTTNTSTPIPKNSHSSRKWIKGLDPLLVMGFFLCLNWAITCCVLIILTCTRRIFALVPKRRGHHKSSKGGSNKSKKGKKSKKEQTPETPAKSEEPEKPTETTVDKSVITPSAQLSKFDEQVQTVRF